MSDHISQGDLQNAIDDARAKLNDLEQMVDDLPTKYGKMADNGQMSFDVGDTFEGPVEDVGRHGDPMVRTDGVVTFLNVSDTIDQDIRPGDSVQYVITEQEQRHAKGTITYVID